MLPVLNISGYHFVRVADAPALRERLLQAGRELRLRGTVLLAEEGINLCLAGTPRAIHDFAGRLRRDERLAPMQLKLSWSRQQPFRRLLVKVKREIIRMNQPAVRPDFGAPGGRAPAVDAHTVRRWLDQGRDDQGREVVTLDTRNAFEVDHGSFEGAIDWRLGKFSDFPAALAANKAQLAGKTVVSFCTGGIRCEKAAIYMRQAGLPNVWQLDGGILRYFEETGGAHFRGDCFVFDEREALDASLAATR